MDYLEFYTSLNSYTMKTLKMGDFIEYEDLGHYGLYYVCCFAHFYLLTTGEYYVLYDPLSKEIYSIVKIPNYEPKKDCSSSVQNKK